MAVCVVYINVEIQYVVCNQCQGTQIINIKIDNNAAMYNCWRLQRNVKTTYSCEVVIMSEK